MKNLKRRANNEGTYYQRKDGRWCGQVMINGYRYTSYGTTEAECRKKLKIKIQKPKERLKGIYNLVDYLYEKLEQRKHKIKESSYRDYHYYLDRLKPKIEGYYVHEVDDAFIATILEEFVMEDSTVKEASKYIKSMLSLLKDAFEAGYIVKPTLSVPKRKTDKNYIKYLEVDLVKEKLEEITNPHTKFFFLLLLYTGLRTGEAYGLKWSDVNLDKCTITINRNIVSQRKLTDGDSRYDVQLPKNGIKGQFVQFPVIFKDIIKAYKETDNAQDDDYIFYQREGKVSKSTMANMATAFFKELGVRGSCHNFRHLHASLLMKLGVDVLTIQHQLRHSNIAITDKYLHSFDTESRESIKKLNF